MIVIRIDFENDEAEDAEKAYEAIEGVLYRLGQVGTLSMCATDLDARAAIHAQQHRAT